MKTIQIQSLSLVNFKGIRKLDINSFDKETYIHGANESGKTTVADSWPFITHGKNSQGETNFSIKTLDKDNNVIPKLEHEVEYGIIVDNEPIKLKKIYREKWVKKRGSTEAEFNGNEAVYEWNDVPMTLRDFQAKMNSIIDEQVLFLITNPLNFCQAVWGDKKQPMWRNQRNVLLEIAGGISDEEVANGNPDFEELLSKLVGKDLPEFEKQIKSSIKKMKDELKTIPTRIDEVERGKPEAIDFDDVERDLEANKKELSAVEKQITDKLEAQREVLARKSKLQKEIHSLESDIEDEKHKLKLQAKTQYQKQSSQSNEIASQIEAKNNDLTKAKKTLKNINDEIDAAQTEIKSLKEQNDKIRSDWNARNAEEFKMDEDSCKCPTCKREFEAEDIEAKKKELFTNFQNAKMKDLESLSARGKKNKTTIEFLEGNIAEFEKRKTKGETIEAELIADLEELHSALDTANDNTDTKSEAEISKELIENSNEIAALNAKIVKLNAELENEKSVDVSELKAKRETYEKEIEKLNKQLSVKDQIEAANTRIDKLSIEESELAQQIANYEKDQFTIEQFNKAKMDALENKINHRFELVNFKLFEQQVNGGETPTCKALINGVPFSDANTASKINAGIDIINTLCEHYQVSAPIFIDNRESVTKLIDSPAQIINLVVDPTKRKLEVKSNVEQMETV